MEIHFTLFLIIIKYICICNLLRQTAIINTDTLGGNTSFYPFVAKYSYLCAVGINEIKDEIGNINVYPNPAQIK